MTREQFQRITARYTTLRVALVGDFCLDRYLEIDPARGEVSLETGLAVHNVVNIRAQPGGAGTILNNLVALGAGQIHPVGFCGPDGEGFELRHGLAAQRGVSMDRFLQTDERRTFTYCKPLLIQAGQPPTELNRLDFKNWSPTPATVEDALIRSVRELAARVEVLILLDQVDLPNTGVVTDRMLWTIREVTRANPTMVVLADSRRGLSRFPPVTFKMNTRELAVMTGLLPDAGTDRIREAALTLARRNGHTVFVTLSERGIVGAMPDGAAEHVAALPVRGTIDIVGAGDCVTANLALALAAGASLREALVLANAAASLVVHQLGTTGAASVEQLRQLVVESTGHVPP